jgi:O-antigen/teichoic acid export membrane protein
MNILGVDDYGVYSLVAGVVSILSFFTNSLIGSTQRFLSVTQGKGDIGKLKEVFSNSLLLHIGFGLLVSAVLAALLPFMFNGFLNIPIDRIEVAKRLYLLVILMVYTSFIASPYRALLVSHENIVYTSIVDVFDGILKLLIAILLSKLSYDHLISYSSMLTCIFVFNLLAFVVYAAFKFPEFHMPKLRELNKTYIKGLSNFAGWTVYSAGCIVARNQGISVVLNLFYGAIVNSAYGIAIQVSGAVQFVSNSIVSAMNPQIMKAEGAGERSKMLRLCEFESKYAFLLLSMVAIPLIAEMDTILQIWLKEVPEHAVMFCRFILVAALCDQITIGLTSANQAIGRIKTYSLVFYTLKLLVIVIGWLCLKKGFPIDSIMWCYVLIEFTTSLIRLPLMKHVANISIMTFCKNVFIRIIVPCLIMIITSLFCTRYLSSSYRLVITTILSCGVGIIAIWFTALGNEEKSYVKTLLSRKK